MIVGEPDNKKILFFQEIPKRIHLHSNCEKIKFLGQFGVRWTLRVMPPLNWKFERFVKILSEDFLGIQLKYVEMGKVATPEYKGGTKMKQTMARARHVSGF